MENLITVMEELLKLVKKNEITDAEIIRRMATQGRYRYILGW